MTDAISRGARRAVPYVQLLDFLDRSGYESLLEHVAARTDAATPSSTIDPRTRATQYDEAVRRSRIVPDVKLVWPRFEDRLQALLPRLRRELGVDDFPLGSVERQLTVHTDGDFFSRHRDENDPGTDGCRMITFVYYFNAEPKCFEGGQLRLYDTVQGPRGARRPVDTYTEIEPAANSIIFFPADANHEVVPVRATGDGPGATRCTLNGWFHAGDLGRPVIPRVEPDVLSVLGARLLPRFTDRGFEVRPTPEAVHRLVATVRELWEQARDGRNPEPAIAADSPDDARDDTPELIPMGPFGDEILERLAAVHEEWAGVPLRPIVATAIRVYGSGQRVPLHISPPGTDVVSSMLVVAEDLDAPWPFVVDLGDRRRELRVEPGEMVLFEGAAIPHGHPSPLEGRSYSFVLLHYCPVDWPHSAESLIRRALSEGIIDAEGRLPTT